VFITTIWQSGLHVVTTSNQKLEVGGKPGMVVFPVDLAPEVVSVLNGVDFWSF